jgi:5-formyltetrahydrofolate cyclo-ligase
MAKKKKIIDLSKQNIEYTQENSVYKVLRFNPEYMTVHVSKQEESEKKDIIDMPFAHLPKAIKKIIKPN